MASKKKRRKVLIKARDLMNDGGKHWMQGEFEKQFYVTGQIDVETSYCSVGAINKASVGDSYPELNPSILSFLKKRKRKLSDQVCRDLFELGGLKIFRKQKYVNKNSVVDWNDHHKTTWSEVDAAFAKAIKELS